jgi:hypothetical protein
MNMTGAQNTSGGLDLLKDRVKKLEEKNDQTSHLQPSGNFSEFEKRFLHQEQVNTDVSE